MLKIKRTMSIIIVATIMVGAFASCKKETGEINLMKDNWNYKIETITSEQLSDKTEQQNRFLTIPNSRIVLNPFNFESQGREISQVEYSNRASMPLNIGYCDPFIKDARGREITDTLVLAEEQPELGDLEIQTIWQGGFDGMANWFSTGSPGIDYTANFLGDKVELSVVKDAKTAWQSLDTSINLDVEDSYVTFTLNAIETTGATFTLKANKGSSVDKTLFSTNTPGTYTINIHDVTGWSGNINMNLKFFAVGSGAKVTFSNAKIEKGKQKYKNAKNYQTEWRPDRLTFTADYEKGTNVTGTDFFYNENTIIRDLVITGESNFIVYGKCTSTTELINNTIVIGMDTFKYAITSSNDIKPLFFDSQLNAAMGINAKETPDSKTTVFSYVLDNSVKKDKISFALSYGTKNVSNADIAKLSTEPFSNKDFALSLDNRKKTWDELLSRIPRPENFELTLTDKKDVTTDQIKNNYYFAWVQIIGNLLPESPEVNFNYPSFATGKPSLWAYASPLSPYSATWEALYGMQYYAQIDPDVAWKMYEGLMSLVDESGMIAGESLPSVNARTGWIIYNAKKDKDALKRIQPALEKHIKWRFENPRWIWLDKTPDTFQKDMDFVSSALIDVQYLMKINQELGLETLNENWTRKIKSFYFSMKLWFFNDSLENPIQYYSTANNVRSEGNPLWVLKSMHVPNLQQAEYDKLLKLFNKLYDIEKPFCGLPSVKVEVYQYTLYGLLEHGEYEKARIMAETALRDIVIAGVMAEGYYQNPIDIRPLPDGVRPSMFGCALFIDNIFILNGMRFDDGKPVLINYFDNNGRIENLHVDSGTFNFIKEGDKFSFGGSSIQSQTDVLLDKNTYKFIYDNSQTHPFK